MSYKDIDGYLSSFGIDITKETSGTNSKWVYTKDLLADAPEETVLKIADELEIDHNYAVSTRQEVVEATFWEPYHFRLFLSHLSSSKKVAGVLQVALRNFGISAFVAHVDIKPTKEWQDEIETGLLSMDALAADLRPGFKNSDWTDQEVGVAIGRGVLIIPLIHGLNPYGFIGKYQGLDTKGKTVFQVAYEIFNILVTSSQTRPRMLTCIIDTTLQAQDKNDALKRLQQIDGVKNISSAFIDRLREGATKSPTFNDGIALDYLNKMLENRGYKKVNTNEEEYVSLDDIPF
jgi:hypothetical protein